MAATLEQSNAQLRRAVETRLATGSYDEFVVLEDGPATTVTKPMPEDAAAEVSSQRFYGHAGACCRGPSAAEVIERFAPKQDLRPGSAEFMAVLDELKDLHLRKTLDYGIDEDALSNIRNSADVVNMPAWAGCVLRMMDKMHRLKAFFRRGRCEFDGIEDTLKDICCYSAIALVLHREER